MLLSLDQFHTYAKGIAGLKSGAVGFDFETNGLQVRSGARAFIMGFAFRNDFREIVKHSVLTSDPRFPEVLRLFLSNPNVKYLAHNAKFELSFCRHQFNCEVEGDIWDTEVFARVEYNTHLSYSLENCAKRIGLDKYRPLMDWLKKHRKLHHEAPFELIIPYVEQDAWLEIPLYEHQKAIFTDWQKNSRVPIAGVVGLELKTTKNLFEIEDAGLEVDTAYCERALEYEQNEIIRSQERFREITGSELVESRKVLQPIFDRLGIPYLRTEKGNASFTEEALAPSKTHEVVATLLRHRRAVKRSSSYWSNFLELATNGKIYPNIKQCGAKSFRMSISDPSAQNWATDDEPDCVFPIRRAFTCGSHQVVASLDYAQMELRKMCDEAGDQKMARAFVEGTDFHQEVANTCNVPRSLAKNGRFAKLYGAGVPRVATTLGVEMAVAERLCRALDQASPEIAAYCRGLINNAKTSPFAYNWLGRRYHFEQGHEYKAPNFRIQGGCAEILRIAIDDVMSLIRAEAKGDTKLILPVHDELVLRMDKCDIGLMPEIKRLMIAAQRDRKILSMDVSMAMGPNFHDLETYE